MKKFKYFLIAVAVLAVIVSPVMAGTVEKNPYGTATPYLYNMDNWSMDSYYMDFPTLTANDTMVGAAATQTLTNKTLTSPTLITPALGTAASGVLTNCTGLPTAGLVDAAVTSAKLSEGTIQFVEVALSNAQILALTTPVEVVAAPGAGKVISFVDAIVIHDVGTADFATAHNVTINYKADGTGAAVSTTLVSPFISGAVSDKISTLKQLTTDLTTATKADWENQPLTIKAHADPITGDGVGRVKVWYRVFSTGL